MSRRFLPPPIARVRGNSSSGNEPRSSDAPMQLDRDEHSAFAQRLRGDEQAATGTAADVFEPLDSNDQDGERARKRTHYEAMDVDTPPRDTLPPPDAAAPNVFGFASSSSRGSPAPPPPPRRSGTSTPALDGSTDSFLNSSPARAFGLVERTRQPTADWNDAPDLDQIHQARRRADEGQERSNGGTSTPKQMRPLHSRSKSSAARRKAHMLQPDDGDDDDEDEDGHDDDDREGEDDAEEQGPDDSMGSIVLASGRDRAAARRRRRAKEGGALGPLGTTRARSRSQFTFAVHHHHAPGSQEADHNAWYDLPGGAAAVAARRRKDAQGPDDRKWINRSTPYALLAYVHFASLAFVAMVAVTISVFFLSTLYFDVRARLMTLHAELGAESLACAKAYVDNFCERETRAPAMERACGGWEQCMARDKNSVSRTRVVAETLAEVVNGFVDVISWKTMIFVAMVLGVTIYGSSLALSRMPQSSNQQQPAQIFSPYGNAPPYTFGPPFPQLAGQQQQQQQHSMPWLQDQADAHQQQQQHQLAPSTPSLSRKTS